MADNDVVILSAVRTAQGRFQGGLSGTSAVELAAIVMKEALARAGVGGDQLDDVIFGNVIQAGLGQNVARQAELKAGIPDSVPAMTVNRVCASGAAALIMAATAIKAGEGEAYLVGGTESMTRAPWVLQNGRSGYRMGLPSDKFFDTMVLDGLWCAVGDTHMGLTAETLSERFGIGREIQDEVAYRSHVNAAAAIKGERFKGEIVPVTIPQRKGDPIVVDTDECPRFDASLEAMAKLKPFFKPDGGVVTAGNSSAIADGASALVVTSRKKAAELGLKPIATLVSHATVAVPADIMGYGETVAAQRALDKAGLTGDDVDLAELNEAFACVAVLATRELGIDPERVNVNGGAVALGHPVGSTGARMIVTLIHELAKRKAEIGLTAACVGGGQGAATVIRLER
ncbi:MAG TPA: acetyl-CoA C-acetyltransferase [Thermoleophilia bacterium]|nr:acetyl-CoA C-acetyltransferase [Thermoleophilia bacterium]